MKADLKPGDTIRCSSFEELLVITKTLTYDGIRYRQIDPLLLVIDAVPGHSGEDKEIHKDTQFRS